MIFGQYYCTIKCVNVESKLFCEFDTYLRCGKICGLEGNEFGNFVHESNKSSR